MGDVGKFSEYHDGMLSRRKTDKKVLLMNGAQTPAVTLGRAVATTRVTEQIGLLLVVRRKTAERDPNKTS